MAKRTQSLQRILINFGELYSHTDNTRTLQTAVVKMYSMTNNSVTSGVTPRKNFLSCDVVLYSTEALSVKCEVVQSVQYSGSDACGYTSYYEL